MRLVLHMEVGGYIECNLYENGNYGNLQVREHSSMTKIILERSNGIFIKQNLFTKQIYNCNYVSIRLDLFILNTNYIKLSVCLRIIAKL